MNNNLYKKNPVSFLYVKRILRVHYGTQDRNYVGLLLMNLTELNYTYNAPKAFTSQP